MTVQSTPSATPTATPAAPSTPVVAPQGTPTEVAPPASAVTPAEAAPAATPEAAAPAPVVGDAKTVVLPTSAMKKLKEDERQRGRLEYAAELDAQAVANGFANHAEALAAAAQARATPAAVPPAEEAAPAVDPKAEAGLAKERAKAEERHERSVEEKKRNNIRASRHRRQLEQLKLERDQKEAEGELKLAAQAAGVTDVDYAVTVLQRAIKGMDEQALATFDERKFFGETMRASHPHLYKPEDRPVTTGNGAANPAPTTPSAAPAPGTAPNGALDARKLSPTEFQNLLRKKGLNIPSIGGTLA